MQLRQNFWNAFGHCHSYGALHGMPRLRQTYVPQPVGDRSAADLRA